MSANDRCQYGVLSGLAVGIIIALLSASITCASTATSAAALQQCPSVEDEIVDLELLGEALRGTNAVGFL